MKSYIYYLYDKRYGGVQLLPSPLKAICSLHGLHMSDVNLGGTPPAIMANTTHVFTQLYFGFVVELVDTPV